QVENRALEKNQRTLDFRLRSHGALTDLIREPESLNPGVERSRRRGRVLAFQHLQSLPNAQNVIDYAASLGLRGMRREHRLNSHGIEQALDFTGRNATPAQFVKRMAQRHRRPGLLAPVLRQAPHSLALFTQVDKVEKKTERVRHVRCFAECQPIYLACVQLEQLRTGVLAKLLRELAQALDGREHLFAALLLSDGTQSRGEQAHFVS